MNQPTIDDKYSPGVYQSTRIRREQYHVKLGALVVLEEGERVFVVDLESALHFTSNDFRLIRNHSNRSNSSYSTIVIFLFNPET